MDTTIVGCSHTTLDGTLTVLIRKIEEDIKATLHSYKENCVFFIYEKWSRHAKDLGWKWAFNVYILAGTTLFSSQALSVAEVAVASKMHRA